MTKKNSMSHEHPHTLGYNAYIACGGYSGGTPPSPTQPYTVPTFARLSFSTFPEVRVQTPPQEAFLKEHLGPLLSILHCFN